MGRPKRIYSSKPHKQKLNPWLVSAVVGGLLLVIAAVALAFRGGEEQPGQTTFDKSFEPEVSGAPRVEVLPNPDIDYGDVKLGTTITTEYRVRNVGDEPLVIYGEPRVELVEGC